MQFGQFVLAERSQSGTRRQDAPGAPRKMTAQQVQMLVTLRGPQSWQSWPKGHQFVTAAWHGYCVAVGSEQ